MPGGFEIVNTRSAGAGVIEEVKSVASQQYVRGAMLAVTAGLAALVTATGKGTHIFQGLITPVNLLRPAVENLSTAAGERVEGARVEGGDVVLKSELRAQSAPPINGVACNTNASATSAVVTAAGSTNDYNNGTCYVPELDQQRLITADSVTTGVHTFTVEPAFSRAPTVGDTLIAVPFCKGATAVKFAATNPHLGIGTAVADKTGGNNKIEDVDLKNLLVYTSCPDQK